MAQITELEGHEALVTSVVVVPNTAKLLNYCWTSSLDGTIRYWDFSTPELIKTINIRLPIFSMVIQIENCPSLVILMFEFPYTWYSSNGLFILDGGYVPEFVYELVGY